MAADAAAADSSVADSEVVDAAAVDDADVEVLCADVSVWTSCCVVSDTADVCSSAASGDTVHPSIVNTAVVTIAARFKRDIPLWFSSLFLYIMILIWHKEFFRSTKLKSVHKVFILIQMSACACISHRIEYTHGGRDMVKRIIAGLTIMLVTLTMTGCWAAGYSNEGSDYVQSGSKYLDSFGGENIKTGKTVDSSAFSGHKLTLIYFWATYDSAGIRQFDTIEDLYAEYKGDGLNVIGVAVNTREKDEGVVQKKLDRAKKNIKDHKISYVNIVPSNDFVGKLHKSLEVMPTGIFVDENGEQVGSDVGGVKKIDEWKDLVNDYIDGKDD